MTPDRVYDHEYDLRHAGKKLDEDLITRLADQEFATRGPNHAQKRRKREANLE
jgi:hypothetical protein